MNKLIVVTGGTKGIGRAIIEKFSSQGFDIVTCSRNQRELDELKSTLQKSANNAEGFVHRADLSDITQVKVFCDFVKKT